MAVTRAPYALSTPALPGTLVTPPPPGRRAAVLVLPSIFGADAGTLSLADDVAGWGGPVGLPELFWRTDPGPAGLDEAGRARAMARMRSYDRDQGVADLADHATHLRGVPGANGEVVALGICFGGHLAMLLAARGAVDAVVTVHGGGLERTLNLAERMKVPMSLHFGEADSASPPEAIAAVRAAFAGRSDVEIQVHPGAGHGFAHPGHPAFQEAASAASRASLKRLLDHLSTTP